jgi:hypothetical protein
MAIVYFSQSRCFPRCPRDTLCFVKLGVRFSWSFLGAAALSVLGCQNYHHSLQRSQGYYEQNQYEMALAVLRNLEADQSSLDSADLVRYCYLRGMTDYRLGFRDDARYWLGLSKAAQAQAQGALQEDESARLEKTLMDLNRDVFGAEAFPEPPPSECVRPSDCDDGMSCKDGVCVPIEDPAAVELPKRAEPATAAE